MADFNKLKDTIRGAIYPNGRGAISADKHQAALLDMADTMQETAAQVTELSEEIAPITGGKLVLKFHYAEMLQGAVGWGGVIEPFGVRTEPIFIKGGSKVKCFGFYGTPSYVFASEWKDGVMVQVLKYVDVTTDLDFDLEIKEDSYIVFSTGSENITIEIQSPAITKEIEVLANNLANAQKDIADNSANVKNLEDNVTKSLAEIGDDIEEISEVVGFIEDRFNNQVGYNGQYVPKVVNGYINVDGSYSENQYALVTDFIPYQEVKISVSKGSHQYAIYDKNKKFVRFQDRTFVTTIEESENELRFIRICFFNEAVSDIVPNDYNNLGVTISLKYGLLYDMDKSKSSPFDIGYRKGDFLLSNIVSGTLDANGQYVQNIYALVSDFFEFETIEIINSDINYFVVLYDSKKQYVETKPFNTWTKSNSVIIKENNIKYARVSLAKADFAEIDASEFESLNIKFDVRFGINQMLLGKKKIACLGDSITFGYGGFKSYPYLLQAKGVNAINLGISTTMWSGSAGNSRFWERLSDIPLDADYIIVMGGTNDWLFGLTLGSMDDTSYSQESSFYGALKYTAEYLYKNRPNARIGFITPLQCSDFPFEGANVSDGKNSIGLSLRKYADAIVEVAQLYGVPCYDLNARCGLCPNIKEHLDRYFMADGCHPNDLGNYKIFTGIYDFINNL